MLKRYARGSSTEVTTTSIEFGTVFPGDSFPGIIAVDMKLESTDINWGGVSVKLPATAGSALNTYQTIAVRHKRAGATLISGLISGATTEVSASDFRVGDVLELDFDVSVPSGAQQGPRLLSFPEIWEQ